MTPEEREVVQQALEVLVECQPFKLTDEACTRHWNAKSALKKILAAQPHYTNTSNPVDFPKLGCVNHDCAECQARKQEALAEPATDIYNATSDNSLMKIFERTNAALVKHWESEQAKHQEELNKFAEDSVWDGEGP